jgi:hypothetical protein
MLMSVTAAAIAILGASSHLVQDTTPPLIQVQGCADGYDLDIHGRCFPQGVITPQYQAAPQGDGGNGYGGGRHPVPCGNGADVDSRDGQCYPTGTVPNRYQQGRQYYGNDGYYDQRPRRRYYYRD